MGVASKPSIEDKVDRALKKVQWLGKLLVNPKLYDILDESIFQDAAKLDSTLSTVCYFSLFLSQILLLIKLRNPKYARFTKRLVTISSKLKLLSTYISDVRIFNRMWAAIPLMSWLLSTFKKIHTESYSRYDKVLDFVQVTSCLVLQIFENVGFVGDHHFTTQSDKLSLWFNIWCCKLWLLYVVSDIAKVLTRDKIDKNALLSNLGNLPLTVHWSLVDGCLTPLQVGLFGTMSSCFNTIQYWKETISRVQKL